MLRDAAFRNAMCGGPVISQCKARGPVISQSKARGTFVAQGNARGTVILRARDCHFTSQRQETIFAPLALSCLTTRVHTQEIEGLGKTIAYNPYLLVFPPVLPGEMGVAVAADRILSPLDGGGERERESSHCVALELKRFC